MMIGRPRLPEVRRDQGGILVRLAGAAPFHPQQTRSDTAVPELLHRRTAFQ